MFSNTSFIRTLCRWGLASALLIFAALPWSVASAATTTMVAQHSGKCLDVIGGNGATGNGVQLEQWTCVTGANNQQFTTKDMGGGQFEIIASHSGKCVGPVNGGTVNGTYIEQRDCVGSPQQLWSIKNTGVAGMYQVISAPSGRCLDVIGGDSGLGDGVMVELWDCAGSANQTWAMAAPVVTPPAAVVAKHSGKCLDVIGGNTGTANGTRLEQWTCYADADNQKFTFKFVGNGQYEVIAKHSGRCVEVVDGSVADGAPIDQWDCSGAPKQLWKLNDVSGGYKQIISVVSNKCLDVTGGGSGLGDGVPMEQWTCVTGADNQTWTIGGTGTPPQACAPSSVTPAIGTQQAWDNRYNSLVAPGALPDTNDFPWQGSYWVRAYISMASTYGDTKYMTMAQNMIDYWLAHTGGAQGWNTSAADPNQTGLDTGVISDAITLFAYEAWKDNRFAAYRPRADSYISSIERILTTYDKQWYDNDQVFPGSPSLYLQMCDRTNVCGANSPLMYNQGAVLAKALLMVDRVYRLKGQTPPSAYAYKADREAAYFKTFVKPNGNGYVWNYEGARTDHPPQQVEDISHAHLDLSLLGWAKQYGLGGLTQDDMTRLSATMQLVLSRLPASGFLVDGTGTTTDTFNLAAVGFDWIDLVDYDASLLDKTVSFYNNQYANSGEKNPREMLGWAEIQRKRSCVSLY